jgi:DNA polymerase V
MNSDSLLIKTTTTGFASPAESYVDKRLDLNDLIVGNVFSTFYFKYVGLCTHGIQKNDILVIDRAVTPQVGDLVLSVSDKKFKIQEYSDEIELWGKIMWVLSKK